MSLINPTLSSNAQRANSKNLDMLVEKPPSAVTKLALDCFKDIQETELGFMHYSSKIAAGTISYMGALALPIGLATSFVWYNFPRSGSEWLGASATCATALIANKLTQKVTTIAPLTLLATVLGGSILYGAAKVSDVATRSFHLHEEQVRAFQKERHEAIIKDLSQTYLGMSEALAKQFKRTSKTPQQIFAMKQRAAELKGSLAIAKGTMRQMGLSDSEAGQVITPLELALQPIDEKVLALTDDPAYNTDLFITLPIGAWAVPEEVKEAARIKPGCSDRLFAAFGISVDQGRSARRQQEAKEALFAVYDGVANHLQQLVASLKPVRGKRKRECPEFLARVVPIEAKIAAIQAEIARYQIPGILPNEVTAKLEEALTTIRSTFHE